MGLFVRLDLVFGQFLGEFKDARHGRDAPIVPFYEAPPLEELYTSSKTGLLGKRVRLSRSTNPMA